MKWIPALVKPLTPDDVRAALSDAAIQGMTVTGVKGFGRPHGHAELCRGAEHAVDFQPRLKIELAVGHEQLDRAIEAITGAARTGKVGDNKNLVEGLEQALRIRTQETGADAL